EARHVGTLNATGPAQPLTMGGFLEACRRVTGSDARFTWVDEAFLLSHNVAPFTEMPLWIPAEAGGFNQFDFSRALLAGLTFRPLETTIADTLAWDRTRPADAPRRGGLTP